jgi:hypothetical protein
MFIDRFRINKKLQRSEMLTEPFGTFRSSGAEALLVLLAAINILLLRS